jgi:hypothetical protein
VAMMLERAAAAMPALDDMPEVAHKFEVLSGSRANVEGIWRYVERTEAGAT